MDLFVDGVFDGGFIVRLSFVADVCVVIVDVWCDLVNFDLCMMLLCLDFVGGCLFRLLCCVLLIYLFVAYKGLLFAAFTLFVY